MTNQANFVYTDLVGVDSTAISVVGYNDHTNKMFIRFKGNNEIVYNDVPRAEFEALTDPKGSVGQYYAYNIKGEYTGTSQTNTRLRASEAKKAAKPAQVKVDPTKAATNPTPAVVQTNAPKTSRFSVKWSDGKVQGGLGGEPEFQATDETDALKQFWAAHATAKASGFAILDKVVIKSITRYFD